MEYFMTSLEVQNGIHGQPSLDLEVKIKDEEKL